VNAHSPKANSPSPSMNPQLFPPLFLVPLSSRLSKTLLYYSLVSMRTVNSPSTTVNSPSTAANSPIHLRIYPLNAGGLGEGGMAHHHRRELVCAEGKRACLLDDVLVNARVLNAHDHRPRLRVDLRLCIENPLFSEMSSVEWKRELNKKADLFKEKEEHGPTSSVTAQIHQAL